jgi:hypothetical protein
MRKTNTTCVCVSYACPTDDECPQFTYNNSCTNTNTEPTAARKHGSTLQAM